MIEVEADRALADELAAREDVALVAANRPARLARPAARRRRRSRRCPSPPIEASLELVVRPRCGTSASRARAWSSGSPTRASSGSTPRSRAGTGVSTEPRRPTPTTGTTRSTTPAAGNPCGATRPLPCDDSAHGIHVTGTAVGTTAARTGSAWRRARAGSAAATWIAATGPRRDTPSASSSSSRRRIRPARIPARSSARTSSATRGAARRARAARIRTSCARWSRTRGPPGSSSRSPPATRARLLDGRHRARLLRRVVLGRCDVARGHDRGFQQPGPGHGGRLEPREARRRRARGRRSGPPIPRDATALSLPGRPWRRRTSRARSRCSGRRSPSLANHVPETEALLRATAVRLLGPGVRRRFRLGRAQPGLRLGADRRRGRGRRGPGSQAPPPPAPRLRVTRPPARVEVDRAAALTAAARSD